MKYYLGLDLGTNSVGWALTDENYNLLKLKGKTAWGSRIFEDAESKKNRRKFRLNRRRIQRRKYRLELLNELFAEEVRKVDKQFLLRLENSAFTYEDKDKNIGCKNLIFKTRQEEVDFYKKFPTIWHLRKELINGNKEALSDIRNVYLAIHHIIKYRGNFLTEGEKGYKDLDDNIVNEIDGCFEDFNCVKENVSSQLLKNVLSDESIKDKRQRAKEVKKLLFNVDMLDDTEESDVDLYVDIFTRLAVGLDYKLSKINSSHKEVIDFSDNFDEVKDEIESCLGQRFNIVLCAKKLYDFMTLNNLMKGHEHISEVMCDIYEQHKQDLGLLKRVIKEIDVKLKNENKNRIYYKVFKSPNEDEKYNYAHLINKFSKNDVEGFEIKKRVKINEFHSYIKKIIDDNREYISDEDYFELDKKLKSKSLLKLIAHESTSVIPHQCHLEELKKIIQNASKIYPFMAEIEDKLIDLFKFRVPYYFGPLSDKSSFSWIKRTRYDRVTPWNIDKIIDKDETRENFMNKLINRCSYLLGEKVLPQSSLVYEEYLILDKLNVLRINDNLITQSTKEELFKFITERDKTTVNDLSKFLKNIYSEVKISGVKNDVPFIATSHNRLSKSFDLQKDYKLLEELILLATIYSDDKKELKEILDKDYKKLSDKQIETILNLPTKKWGRLSRKLLCELTYEDESGVIYSIIDVMNNENKNFEQVLYDNKYNFIKLIEEENKRFFEDNSCNEIDMILEETPTLMSRSINQTLLIIEDIVKATKCLPEKIFIESTRTNDEKLKGKEKDSRYKQIEKSLKKDKELLSPSEKERLKSELDKINEENSLKLKSKHIYLYFMQLGKDMYTGKNIDLNDVLNSNKYDVDHIVPQSLIKDDSLDNLVLVNREMNQNVKKEIYPIPSSIKTKEVLDLWNILYKKKYIKEKKYNNLMRTVELSLEEIEDFVARQINVINYSNVSLKRIIELKYPSLKGKLVFSKSQYPSFVRNEYNIVKNRDLNDAHHAIDAYLNVVTGNILKKKYSSIEEIYNKRKIDSKSISFNMNVTIKNELNQNNKIALVKNNCLKHDALVTFKLDYPNGMFYKQTIYKRSDNASLIPIHTNTSNPLNDTKKYGGYKDLKKAYILVVSYKEKNKSKKILLPVPVLYATKYNDNESVIKLLTERGKKVSEFNIIKKVHLNQKIIYENCVYLLYTSDNNCNKYKLAYQSYLDNDMLAYLQKANKYKEQLKEYSDDVFEEQTSRNGNIINISKEENMKIFDEIIKIYRHKTFDKCNFIEKERNKDREEFYSKSLGYQIEELNNMIKLLSRKGANNKFLRPTLDITNKKITLINESPTGLYSYKEEI